MTDPAQDRHLPNASAPSLQKVERRGRYQRGLRSELLAVVMLTLKGYVVLAHRAKTPLGEIDLIARRGNRLAFIEVKHRARREDAETALTPRQADRISRAASLWLARRSRYQHLEPHIDLVASAPRTWPRHIRDITAGNVTLKPNTTFRTSGI